MLSIFQKYRYIDVDIDVSPNISLYYGLSVWCSSSEIESYILVIFDF